MKLIIFIDFSINNIFLNVYESLKMNAGTRSSYIYLRCCKNSSMPGIMYKVFYWILSIATELHTYIWMSKWLHGYKKYICMSVCLYTYVSDNLFREIFLNFKFAAKKNLVVS